MGRCLRLGLAASAAAGAIAASAQSAMGIGGSLPVATPVHVQPPSVPVLPAAPALPAPPGVVHHGPAAPRVPASPLPVVATVVAANESSGALPVSAASGGRASGGAAGAGTAAAAAAATQRSDTARRRARETRRLRDEVKRLRGCLGVLPELDRHLIQMRAGIDGPALTRRAAARQLRITVGRAHRIERSGIREMRAASREGRCGAHPESSHAVQAFRLAATGGSGPALVPAVSFPPAPAAAATPSAPAKQRPHQAVLGTQESSPPAQRPPGGSRVAASATPSHGHGLVIALVVLLLAANLLAAGVWLLRKRAERGGYLDFGPAPDETPERPREADEQAGSKPPWLDSY